MVGFGCKYCGSTDVVRYGQTGGIQYWWCKDCERKFADNDAIVGMRTPYKQVSAALGMYYRGMSIDIVAQLVNELKSLTIDENDVSFYTVRDKMIPSMSTTLLFSALKSNVVDIDGIILSLTV